MRIGIILFLLFIGFSAGAEVCITDIRTQTNEASSDAQLYQAAYKCQDIETVSNGLTVASVAQG